MIEPPAERAASRKRRRNRRPKLLFPILQTAFLPPLPHVCSRLYRWLVQPIYRSRLYDWSLGHRSNGEFASIPSIDWPLDTEIGERLLADEFRLGGEIVRDPAPLGDPPGASIAWRGYLHGFVWLDQLRAVSGPAARAKARQAIDRWLNENQTYDAFAWRADFIAQRLHRLIVNHEFLDINNDALFRARVLHAMNREAMHLMRALPDGCLGSALLRAAIALILAGAVLPEGARFAQFGRNLFQREIGRQILGDGGHIERSPAIMRDLLRRLLDLRAALQTIGRPLPDALSPTIMGLAGALDMLCHGDGDIAQFNDSSAGQAMLTRRCLSEAGDHAQDLALLPDTGFARLAAGPSVLILDCGQPPPAGYDLHAHAGALSFEFSHGGERLIVNCGAHPNAAEWRDIQRTTAAHSTLVVEDTNSSVLLPLTEASAVGLALRPDKVDCRREETSSGALLEAMHDGYVAPFGLTHLRRLLLAQDGDELLGEDHVLGAGACAFALRFHLHPSVQAVVTQNGQAALLKPPSGIGWRLRLRGGEIAIADSAALGLAGQVRRAQQLVVLGLAKDGGTAIKWSLQRESRRR